MAQRKSRAIRLRGSAKKKGDASGSSLARRARQRVRDETRKAAKASLARARDLGEEAKKAMRSQDLPTPHISLLRSPDHAPTASKMGPNLRVASYNVHRWTGLNGRAKPDMTRAAKIIGALNADIIALQEVLRPRVGPDSLEGLAEELGLYIVFAANRLHKRGEVGNAILSRFPIVSISVLDLFSTRMERRCALAATFDTGTVPFGVVATHLSLVDRTRHKQVEMLLEHPQWNAGPAVLVGDMNAWRECKASQSLEENLNRHNNVDWPSTFPSTRPLLALDRIYASGAKVVSVAAHDTPASRKASDHLPVVARVRIQGSAR